MKKIIPLLCFFLAAALLFAACGNGDSPHVHAVTQWSCDAANHWYICQCGETVTEPHSDDSDEEGGRCAVCGVSVRFNDDGTYCILAYDEHGSVSTQANFTPDGSLLSSIWYEREYYKDGNPKHLLEYHDNVLVYETTWLPTENDTYAEVYVSEDILYDAEGKVVSRYDENRNLLTYTAYDTDGKVISEDIYEYGYDEAGNMTYQVCHTDGVKTYECYYALNETDSQTYPVHEIYYDRNGNRFADYRYDSEGNLIQD